MLSCLTLKNSQNDVTSCRQVGIQAELIAEISFLLYAEKKTQPVGTFFMEEPLASSCQDLCVWLRPIQDLVPVKRTALKSAVQNSIHLY